MEAITQKRYQKWSIFLILSGLGALWLTLVYNKINACSSVFGRDSTCSYSDMFNFDGYISKYLLFNSVILICLALLLKLKAFKSYSVVAIILCISVTLSLLVFSAGSSYPLFVNITLSGLLALAAGGPILVPMFLLSVYISAIRGIQYLGDIITYENAPIRLNLINKNTSSDHLTN